ncbi:MAG: SH3 domain-containing protein [Notoacmeibacter sp.]|nr:SH3 domain-containing protein [Notoacmeibacter sp.]MCC0032726.1 SH3 domain-containing protein [Brucellaceae bacterium]
MRLTGFLTLAASVLLAAPALADVSEWACDQGDMSYIVTHDTDAASYVEVEVSVGEQMDQSLARTYRIPGQASGNVHDFQRGGDRFYSNGARATLQTPDDEFECEPWERQSGAMQERAVVHMVAESGVLNAPGRSLGGKMRAGPGVDFPQVGSLTENLPVTIRRNSGVSFNGYDWFEVSANGRIGYQWGGIMCSEGQQLAGIFEQCGARDQARAPAAQGIPAFSFGGKLRAGPGENFPQIGSVANRTPVLILRNSGVRMGDWDWMEIRVNGKTGYMWGGLLCPDREMVPGIFERCNI